MPPESAISVLVATYRSPDSMERVARAVLAQLSASDELIVVDDGSGDETPALLRRIDDQRLTVIEQHNQGVSAARNRAAAEASAPILLFVDDDEIPAPGWLEAHRDAHGIERQVVMGRAELVVPAGLRTRVITAPEPPSGDQRASLLVNDSFSVDRAHFHAVGGFDARFVHGGEDVDLGLRLVDAGGHLVVAPSAVIRHEIDRTYREFRRQRLRRGHASLLLEDRHGMRLVASPEDLRGAALVWRWLAAWPSLAEVTSLGLWGIVRVAALVGLWSVQAAAAGRITLLLGLVGRARALEKRGKWVKSAAAEGAGPPERGKTRG